MFILYVTGVVLDSMQLTVLGSGSPIPDGRRMQSGFLIEAAEETILVDCGSGVLHRLSQTEIGVTGFDTVLLTHHHLDHTADLGSILTARWLLGTTDLEVIGPPGTSALLNSIETEHEYLSTEMQISVRDIDENLGELGPFNIAVTETDHPGESLAYRITCGDRTVTMGGDSAASAGLISFASPCNLLVHDCSFPDGTDVTGHPTPIELASVVAGRPIDHLLLTHLFPTTIGKEAEMVETIQKEFDGDVEIATDLDVIEV